MKDNPYQSPRYSGITILDESSLRGQARRSVRITALVLFVPALYNYWAFDRFALAGFSGDIANVYRAANILGLVVAGLLVWSFGLPGLETVSRWLRLGFARGADAAAWDETFYRSVRRMAYLAVPDAVLWAIWVFGFYQLGSDFYTISWAVGVPAHLLAACWYVPLIYRWYRLATREPTRPTP